MKAGEAEARLRALADDEVAAGMRRFFKTGPGDYGEGDRFRGALDMSSGYALTLEGEILPDDRSGFSIVGLGIDGTPTKGWRYDYHGVAGYEWPNGVGQVSSLLGTVIRVNAHGPSSPAGYTASFIAVRHS